MCPTGLIDLHCDTLTRDAYPDSLDRPGHQLSLSKMPAGVRWLQCFAIFVPDRLRGQDAIAYFEHYAGSFHRQMARFGDRIAPCRCFRDMEAAFAAGKFGGMLTVEGGAVLAGRLDRIQIIHDAGVRMMTLTWNGPNEIGSGHDTPGGLTAFGREAVAEMERVGVLVDVSHLNDRGFEDVLSAAKKPFVASHSNLRSVCRHWRNLPEEFVAEMVRRGGLIGLNYTDSFLSDEGRGNLDDLYRHVCRFLELGAEHCLALGSDYDGTDIHPDLDSVEKSLNIYGYLTSHGIPAEIAGGILFGNAWNFFRTWLP